MFEQAVAMLFSIGDLQGFIELGGPVLVLVICAGFVMWLLIFERVFYLAFGLPRDSSHFQALWLARAEHGSWRSRQIRHGFLAELKMRANRYLGFVRTLIAVAPLLGLLGTVTGMLEVFDVMAQTGSSNARAMAAGISRATIPTMAGMVMALAGLYVNALLTGWANRSLRHIRFHVLELEGGNNAPA